jgi:serine/threonine protein kinase
MDESDRRYIYEETLLGEGGFGKVRKAHDTALDRDVAIKTLDQLVLRFNEPEQERFKREAKTLAKLSHPNIPAIYDVDFSPGKFDIIFQFIDGQTLRKVIDKNGPSQLATTRLWFHQLASALDHAHKLEVIHRDIKPENIIITPDSESAYLVDFGIALSTEEAKRLTRTGYVIGTPGYMSPEQEAGEPLNSRSDIYSLAVTFYEVLAGKRIRPGNYEPLAVNEAIPSQIDDLILDCLEPKERRIESAKLFMARLDGALSHPTKPLSDILAHGRLHELSATIEVLSPSDFAALPAGQKVLIVSKVVDVVGSNDPNLFFAGERLLQLMMTRGLLLQKEEYKQFATPALHWGFEKEFEGRVGREPLRHAAVDAAFVARGDAYDVLADEFLQYMKNVTLSEKEDWYLHSLRELIQSMMANPECDSTATELGEALREVNRIQRSRQPTRRFTGF